MNKVLFPLVIIIFIMGGCTYKSNADINKILKICESHGGLFGYYDYLVSGVEVHCNDGVVITKLPDEDNYERIYDNNITR